MTAPTPDEHDAAPLYADCGDLPGRWWVAHTRPRNEKALAGELRAFHVPLYLPLCHRLTRSRRSGRVSRSMVPLFPGYVFFNASEDLRVRVLKTNRVVRILAVSDQAQLVAELRQIDRLLRARTDFRSHDHIRKGQWVRVLEGPLAGMEGVVSGPASRRRLSLIVHMLGQSVSLEVPTSILEQLDGPTYGERHS